MSRVVLVDASVAVKWLVQEQHVAKAIMLLDEADEITAPQILFGEVANALWKKVRRAEIAADTSLDAIRLLQSYIHVVHPIEEFLTEALTMACAVDHPIYDCLYIACARGLNLPLVTADARLIRKFSSSPYAASILPLDQWRP
ncbi:type II toxin-antitoxin system VapC family toxin [Xanthobacter pseudotagetidis]|uniref:type II toxin-antitoxin system VapC family toxin n=1 Tax=Xanthobacter pseudotagetidis TaxID=3119911 RepID=UPI0037298C6B